MKKKVNLKIVEGDEFSVAKNELLYNKVNGEVSLKKRNSKGVLEEITKGNLENKNIVQLYPEDKSKAYTLDFLINNILNPLQECEDAFWGVKSAISGNPHIYIKNNNSKNKEVIDTLLSTLQDVAPEDSDDVNYIMVYGEYMLPYFAYVTKQESSFNLKLYLGYYWYDIIVSPEEAVVVYSTISAQHSSCKCLQQFLKTDALDKITTTSTITTTLDSLTVVKLMSEDMCYYSEFKSLSTLGSLTGFDCSLTPRVQGSTVMDGGFTGTYTAVLFDDNGESIKYLKGTIVAEPANISDFKITTTVTSVSN